MIVLKSVFFLACAVLLLMVAAMFFEKGLIIWGLWFIFMAIGGVVVVVMDFTGWQPPWIIKPGEELRPGALRACIIFAVICAAIGLAMYWQLGSVWILAFFLFLGCGALVTAALRSRGWNIK
jgi:hypothetical protein